MTFKIICSVLLKSCLVVVLTIALIFLAIVLGAMIAGMIEDFKGNENNEKE